MGGDSLFDPLPNQWMETVVRVSHESFDWRTFLIPTGWSESVRDQQGGTIARVMHLHIARYAVSKVSHEGCDWSKKSEVLRAFNRKSLAEAWLNSPYHLLVQHLCAAGPT